MSVYVGASLLAMFMCHQDRQQAGSHWEDACA